MRHRQLNVSDLQVRWRFDDDAPHEHVQATLRKALWPKQRYALMVYRTQANMCRVIATKVRGWESGEVLADGSADTWEAALIEAVADAKRRQALRVLAGE